MDSRDLSQPVVPIRHANIARVTSFFLLTPTF
jgi:hypothetical protein